MSNIKALFFDVFGTVVDWHGSVQNESKIFSLKISQEFDTFLFTDKWRSGFRRLQSSVSNGSRDYLTMDEIHMEILEELIDEFNLNGVSLEDKQNFNQSWHRLNPWSDSIFGLNQLKKNRIISTLSNGNLSMLNKLSKNAQLPWDCVVSTEFFGTYKPNKEVYLGAANLLNLPNAQTMMVAAHAYDLDAAKLTGMKTCYVYRPDEFGIGKGEDPGDVSRFDLVVNGFDEIEQEIVNKYE
tara:strand:+ start:156 stop:872 length:717 start_codon:yes stop_codon:yes gene_type:complete